MGQQPLSRPLSYKEITHEQSAEIESLKKHHAALRQLASDLLIWAQDGFHLASAAEKEFWEMRWEELQQCASELGIGDSHEPA